MNSIAARNFATLSAYYPVRHMAQDNDSEFRQIIDRLDQEGGQRTEPAPLQGEGQPIPQQQHRVRLPLSLPRAAWVLLVLNIAIFLIPEIFGLSEVVLDWGAKSNQAIRNGEYYRFLTAMFLHGSLVHIGFNAFALYSLGFDTERMYGT